MPTADCEATLDCTASNAEITPRAALSPALHTLPQGLTMPELGHLRLGSARAASAA